MAAPQRRKRVDGAIDRAGDIARQLAARAQDVVRYLLPDGELDGVEWRNVGGEGGRSFSVNIHKGLWCDFGNGEKGGDLLDLWAKARCSGNLAAAIAEASKWLGLDGPPTRRAARAKATASARNAAANPSAAALHALPGGRASRDPFPRVHPKHGKPAARYVYRNADGSPEIAVYRFINANGKKWFTQFTIQPSGWTGGAGGALPDTRPLYRLDEITRRANEPVIFVEGEKAADAVARAGFLATTTLGGAGSAKKTDLSPLAGRSVDLWGDNDSGGKKYIDQVADILREQGAELRRVKIPLDAPNKWDAADTDADHIRKLIAGAVTLRRIEAVTLADFLEIDIPQREAILSPWLFSQGINMLFAWRGIGKTMLALNIAYAVASGGRCLRWEAPRARRVLYIDGEMPAATMQSRLASIARSAESHLPADDFFRLVTPDLQESGIPDLATVEGQAAVDEWLEGVDLVLLDNLSTLVRSGEENAGEGWVPIQGWLLELRRRGIASIFVHHAGKGGAQRGTSRREDVLDEVIELRRPKDYIESQGARFEIHLTKRRNLTGADALPIEAAFGQDSAGREVWNWRNVENTQRAQAIEYRRQGLSLLQIVEAMKRPDGTGPSKSTVHRWLSTEDGARKTRDSRHSLSRRP